MEKFYSVEKIIQCFEYYRYRKLDKIFKTKNVDYYAVMEAFNQNKLYQWYPCVRFFVESGKCPDKQLILDYQLYTALRDHAPAERIAQLIENGANPKHTFKFKDYFRDGISEFYDTEYFGNGYTYYDSGTRILAKDKESINQLFEFMKKGAKLSSYSLGKNIDLLNSYCQNNFTYCQYYEIQSDKFSEERALMCKRAARYGVARDIRDKQKEGILSDEALAKLIEQDEQICKDAEKVLAKRKAYLTKCEREKDREKKETEGNKSKANNYIQAIIKDEETEA